MLLIFTIKLLFIQSTSSFLSGLKPPANSWTNRRWPNLEDANKIPSNRWYIDGLETSLHLRKNEVEWAIHHRSTSFPGKATLSELKNGNHRYPKAKLRLISDQNWEKEMQEYAKHLLDGCYLFRLRSARKKAGGVARVFSEVRTILQIASPPAPPKLPWLKIWLRCKQSPPPGCKPKRFFLHMKWH